MGGRGRSGSAKGVGVGRSLRSLPAVAVLVASAVFGSAGPAAAAGSRSPADAPLLTSLPTVAELPAVADSAVSETAPGSGAADSAPKADPRACDKVFAPDASDAGQPAATQALSCAARQADRDREGGRVPPAEAQPNASYHLSGTVRNSTGKAISGVVVEAFDDGGGLAAAATTGSSGEWTVSAAPGTYYLRFSDWLFVYARGWYAHAYPYYPSGTANFSVSGAYASRVVVVSSSIGGLDITMPAATPLAGRVMEPPPNSSVGSIDYDAEFYVHGFYYGFVSSEGDGRYEGEVAPGSYEVYFTDNVSPGLWYKTGSSAYAIDDATEVTVPSSAQYGITRRPQAVLQITLGSGTLDSGADIWIEFCGGPGDLCTVDEAGNRGQSSYPVWPGDYVMRARDASGTYASGYWNGSTLQTDPALLATIHVDQSAGAHVTIPATATCTVVQPMTNSPAVVYVSTYAHGAFQNSVLETVGLAGQAEVNVNCGAAYQVWYYDPDEVRASGWYSSAGFVYEQDQASSISSSGTATLASIEFPAAVHLSGTVRGADGLTIADACVVAWQGSSQPFYAIADSGGNYRTAVSPGTYNVSFNLDRASVCSASDWSWSTHGSYLSGGPYGQGWYGTGGFVFDSASSSAADVVVGASDVTINMILPTVPSAPRGAGALPGKLSANVSWTAPSTTNGSPVTSYVVTSSPSGRTCTTTKTSCTVTGLFAGTSYTFTVQAVNLLGRGLPSAMTSAVNVLAQPATFHPIDPVRVLDTRAHNGLAVKLKANTPVTFQVTSRTDVTPQIPAGASAVTGNVTVVNSSGPWAVYLGPTPIASPSSSTVNFTAGQIVANGVTVALGEGGKLSATYMGPTDATTDLVVDVTGYFTPDASGATFHPIEPARDLDTRVGNGLSGKIYANTPRTFLVAGRNGVPPTATAVTGNVTAVNSSSAWAVYLGPKPISNPSSSTVNFTKGAVVANNVTVALSSTGWLSATYMGPPGATTDLVFDVTGYYTADASGSSFVPLEPARLLDTRVGNGLSGKLQAGAPRSFLVATRRGVPGDAAGVTGNVTVVNETFAWAVFVGPNETATPATSTLNFVKGDIKANGVTVALSPTGMLAVTYLSSRGNTTDLVFDVTGYFVAPNAGLVVAPSSAAISAGSSQSFVAALDGTVVTGATTFSIVAGPGGVKKGATTYPAGSAVPGASCSGSACTATVAGVYSVTGKKGSATSPAAAVTVNASEAASLSVSGLSKSIAAGTIDNGMVVTAFDRYGNVATGFRDIISFASSDPLAIVPGGYRFTAADAGVHRFVAPNGVLFRTPGTHRIMAIDALAASMMWGAESGISVSGSATEWTYHPLTQVCLLDTRIGKGLVGKLAAGTPRTLQVTGRAGIPVDAVAVTGMLVAANASGAGYIYAGPAPVAQPGISVESFGADEVRIPSQSFALSPTGTLSLTYVAPAGETADPVFDVVGYFTADHTGATYHSIDPGSILDTRSGDMRSANSTLTLTVAGRAGVPSGASAISGVVAVLDPSTAWVLEVGPALLSLPPVPVFLDAGQTESGDVTSALSATGTVEVTWGSLTFGGTAHVVVVVTGYFSPAAELLVAPSSAAITAGASESFSAALDGAVVTGSTTFSIVAGPAGVQSGATTYAAGSVVPGATCTANACTATVAGDYSVTGRKGTNTSPASTLTVSAAPASSLSVTGLATSIAPGTVDNGMVVAAVDRYGNVATGFADIVSFASSDPLAVVPGRYQFTASDAGVHHFTAPNGVLFNTPGTHRVVAIDAVASSMIWGAQAGISVSGTAPTSSLHPIAVTRLLDTRIGMGSSGELTAGTARTFILSGIAGIPSGAVAVVGVFTTVNATAGGYLYAGPTPVSEPGISVEGIHPGQVESNELGFPLSGSGSLSLTYVAEAGNTTDAVLDVWGYYTPDDTGAIYHSIDPVSVCDTRAGDSLRPRTPRTFAVTGSAGVPDGATAVSGIAAVIDPTSGWALYVGPDPLNSPPTGTLNFTGFDTQSQSHTTALSATGTLSATYMGLSGNHVDIAFVVTGYYAP
jgi:hypothetical protein